MPAYWKEQLRQIIELTHEHIRGLETGEDGAERCADTDRRTIEARKAIVCLQRTIDALTVTEQNACNAPGDGSDVLKRNHPAVQ